MTAMAATGFASSGACPVLDLLLTPQRPGDSYDGQVIVEKERVNAAVPGHVEEPGQFGTVGAAGTSRLAVRRPAYAFLSASICRLSRLAGGSLVWAIHRVAALTGT